jgi:hypothetical protein
MKDLGKVERESAKEAEERNHNAAVFPYRDRAITAENRVNKE